MSTAFHTVGVAGLATMGAGIADVPPRGGRPVVGAEIDEDAPAEQATAGRGPR